MYGRHHGYRGWGCQGYGPGPGFRRGRYGLTVDEEIKWLEDRQRDLEEELADVVERIRRLKASGSTPSAS
jgi:hypothetical protein